MPGFSACVAAHFTAQESTSFSRLKKYISFSGGNSKSALIKELNNFKKGYWKAQPIAVAKQLPHCVPLEGQLMWLMLPGAELTTVTRSSSRKNSSFQLSDKYKQATKAHLDLWCAKSLLSAAAKLKLPQMTREPVGAHELDTNSLLGAGHPRGTAWQEAGGQLGWCWPLPQPVTPCPRQGFRANRLVLRRWCPLPEHFEGFHLAAAWPYGVHAHCLLGKKNLVWWHVKRVMLVRSKPALWWGTRHWKGQRLENFLETCTSDLNYNAIINTPIWVAMCCSSGARVQGS